ncbi:threonine aldolase family protein [Maritalea sp.]|uniref:threonine aldolase family protein n=1 Tax=Maritalea sp. TaxID=2003361 RepID=UPI003EF4F1B2
MSATEKPIDLRSDTVTKPCDAMLSAMIKAEIGDDQYQDDRETNLLQDEVAQLLGKQNALWLPSGTMANQVALRVATRPGDDVIVSTQCHAVWHETGGSAANSGVQLTDIGENGHFSADQFLAAVKPRNHHIYPPTTMVQIENTHNRCGGRVMAKKQMDQICAYAKQAGIFSHLDGARLWNASHVLDEKPATLAAPFDAVMVSLSKGLGAPGGSILAGSKEFIESATRYRRMFGGAMRQTGYYAAAGRYAIKHNMDRLVDDHANAKQFAQVLAASQMVTIDPETIETNIVVFEIHAEHISAHDLVQAAKRSNVLINALGSNTIRIVTHLDVDRDACTKAADIIVDILKKSSKTALPV